MAILFTQFKCNLPKFYYLLDDMDKLQYDSIRNSQKGGHKKSESKFTNEIENLKKFVVQGNSDDWKRGLVCGIYWLPENKGIATNIQQLKIILNRCKSSLNASLTKIGLNVTLTRGRATNLILDTFPFLKNNSSEIRQWTIRKKANVPNSNLLTKNDNLLSINNDKKEDQIDIFTSENDDNDIFQLTPKDLYSISNNQKCDLYQYNEIF
ncbi:hypothetical protein M9Y10_002903 [Tritrichomonas musculus]|uniref:Initiator binding domain-containing protein n=1 Tax=Tritrichomonas musculus TaxID=1915356 RepID=A0ABR2LB86_9EUKA